MYELSPNRCGEERPVGQAARSPGGPSSGRRRAGRPGPADRRGRAARGTVVTTSRPSEHGAEEQHRRGDQGVDVERRSRESVGAPAPAARRAAGPRRAAGRAADRQRQAHQQQVHQLHDGVDGPAQACRTAAGSTAAVVDVGRLAPGSRASARPAGTICPACSDEVWPSWAPSPIEVSMSSTVSSPTNDVAADGDRAGLDHAGLGAVAVEERVLADHRAVTDRQQVGADRHVRERITTPRPTFAPSARR